jgi:L-ascorbate metabolism protein UlaG (beta-lactamase superfamily)
VLNSCDILMIPVGGGDVISTEQAAELIGHLEPKVVLPMQYAAPIGDKKLATLEPFTNALGVTIPDAEEKLTLRSSDLSDSMRMVVLTPEAEAARR